MPATRSMGSARGMVADRAIQSRRGVSDDKVNLVAHQSPGVDLDNDNDHITNVQSRQSG